MEEDVTGTSNERALPEQKDKPTNPAVLKELDKWWFISMFAVLLCAVAYGYFFSSHETRDVGYLLGYSLPLSGILWYVLRGFNKHQGRLGAWVSFFVILGSLLCGNLVSYVRHETARLQTLTEIQNIYSSVAQSFNDSIGQLQATKTLDTAPKSTGDAGEMERFVKSSINNWIRLRNDYGAGLQAIGWDKILDGDRIAQDANLAESMVMIQQARNLVDNYKSNSLALLGSTRSEIDTLNVSEATKNQLRAGFEKSAVRGRAQVDAMMGLESRTIGEFAGIIDLLSSHKGRWAVRDGKFLFAFPHDLETFNAHLAAIQDLTSQEQAMLKNAISAQNAKFNALKSE